MSTNGNGNGRAHDYQTDALYARTPTALLGSAQRSAQMDRTVVQVEALTERVNQQTQAINNLRIALKAEQQAREAVVLALTEHVRAYTRMSRWQRLRWLVGL